MNNKPRVSIGTIGHRVAGMATASMLAAGIDAIQAAQREHDRIGQPTVKFNEVSRHILDDLDDDSKVSSPGEAHTYLVKKLKEVEQAGFEAGLAAAAKFLDGTAADYKQTSDRLLRNNRTATMHERKEQVVCEEKSKLLTGQAGHIRGLRRL